jgi:hypothetical protein
MRYPLRNIAFVVIALSCSGCAEHIAGRVVDANGHAVSHATVEIHSMFGAMLNDPGRMSDRTVSDSQGRFQFTVPQRRGLVTAKSVDGKQGRVSVPPHGDTVVVVR